MIGAAGSAVALSLGSIQPALARPISTSVNSDPLRVTAGPNFSAVQGSPGAGRDVALITDPGEGATAASFTATIDWGDGTSAETCTSATSSCSIFDNGDGTFAVHSNGHRYPADGSFTVRVTVIDSNGEVGDTAIGRPASQSSYYNGAAFPASLANDGNTDGEFGHLSVAHTDALNRNWWGVDLGAVVPISTVDVWNRTGCCSEREANMYVLASASPLSGDLQADLNSICGGPTTITASCPGAQFLAPIPNPSETYTMNVSARYVHYQQIGNGLPINVAEVVVHGPVWLTATVSDAPLSLSARTWPRQAAGVNPGPQTIAFLSDAGSAVESPSEVPTTIDWGDGGTSPDITTATLVAVPGGWNVQGAHTYGREGAYTVKVSAQEDGGPSASLAFGVGVGDGTLGGWEFNPELGFVAGIPNGNLLALVQDSDRNVREADFSGSVNWGDGSPPCALASFPDGDCGLLPNFFGPGTILIAGGHTYARAGDYTATFTLRDVGGSRSMGTVVYHVAAQVLAVDSSATAMVSPVRGTPFRLDPVRFSDPDGNSNPSLYSVTFVWGDGTTSPGVVTPTTGCTTRGSCFAITAPAHTYAVIGTYTIRMILRDTDGSASATQRRAQVGLIVPG